MTHKHFLDHEACRAEIDKLRLERGVIARIIRHVIKGEDGEYAAKLIERYDAYKPCYYERECLLRGRCPKDPACDE
jgi:hypothetical protein